MNYIVYPVNPANQDLSFQGRRMSNVRNKVRKPLPMLIMGGVAGSAITLYFKQIGMQVLHLIKAL